MNNKNNLFRRVHQPLMQHLKNKGAIGTLSSLIKSNKSFNVALLDYNTTLKIAKLQETVNHIKKGLVLLSILQMANMYDALTTDLRTDEEGKLLSRRIQRLGDDETMYYIRKLATSLINYLGKMVYSLYLDDSANYDLQNFFESSFKKANNEELANAFEKDWRFLLSSYVQYEGNFKLGKHTSVRIYPTIDLKISGLGLYQYFYKYKSVYKHYMNSLGVFRFQNSNNNNNLQREFTLKNNIIKPQYTFSNSNLASIVNKMGLSKLNNLGRSNNSVASLQHLRVSGQQVNRQVRPPPQRENTNLLKNRAQTPKPWRNNTNNNNSNNNSNSNRNNNQH